MITARNYRGIDAYSCRGIKAETGEGEGRGRRAGEEEGLAGVAPSSASEGEVLWRPAVSCYAGVSLSRKEMFRGGKRWLLGWTGLAEPGLAGFGCFIFLFCFFFFFYFLFLF